MFDNLSVRNKFLAVAAVPVNVLVVVAVWAAAIVQEPVLAAVAALGAVLTLVVAQRFGSSAGERISAISEKMNEFDMDAGVEPGGDDAGDEVGDIDRALTKLTRRIKEESDQRRTSANERLGSMMRDFSDRNHRLIDSQLDHIDWLEATEEDSDRLEHLFELDHLANRMRRNGDSIMVLAGVEAHRRSEPAPVTDVLRVAMGYNTRYRDIGLRTVDEVLIDAGSAWEATHLLSELLENATQFSPDDTLVEIHATHLDDGSYRVTIIDHGYGMSDQQLAAASSIISNPPDLDLTDASSIGLQVAGRLAAKLSATVELSQTAGSGVTVEILLPAEVVVGEVESPSGTIETSKTSAATNRGSTPDTGGKLGEWVAPSVQRAKAPLLPRNELEQADEASPAGDPSPAGDVSPAGDRAKTLDEALGADADFDTGVENLLVADEPEVDGGPANRSTAANEVPEALRAPADRDEISALRPAEDDTNDEEWVAPEAVGRAAAEELGLTRRKRGTGPRIAGPGGSPVRASTRKPEEVRSMISQYRDGLKGRKGPAAGTKGSGDEVTAEPKA